MTDPISAFRDLVWEYYHDHGRDLPWRHNPSPYQVVVSEIMLQQTQAARVLERYPRWLQRFPDWQALAVATTPAVLEEWQGMGYNRRALYLQRIAREIVDEHRGQLPEDPTELVKLPGIGPNTAGSIAAFAFNSPMVFIETNIRRVFIHHFFETIDEVHDRELLPLIEQALDRENPREWYYALMDYGSHLAKTVPNPNRRSRHHAVQSRFEGSDRQLRGAILRALLKQSELTESELGEMLGEPEPTRLRRVIPQLVHEKFIQKTHDDRYRLLD